MLLTQLPHPYIVAVATDRDWEGTATTIAKAAEQGAHAVELNLPAIHHLSASERGALCGFSPIAVYTSCRRAPFMRVYGIDPATLPQWTDAERMEQQLAAAVLGTCAIEMELDTFDPRPAPALGTVLAERFAQEAGPPAELSDDPDAISQQRAIIAQAHRIGAEVILSCHTGRPQTNPQLIEIARCAVERGGDLLKIVTPCRSRDELRMLLRTTAHLSSVLPIPFVLIGAGAEGLPSRWVGPKFGSGWFIAQTENTPDGFPDQPLVADVASDTAPIPWFAEV